VHRPELISEIAERFGSQAVVVAIDAKRENGGFEVFVAGGRTATGRDAIRWAREAASRGAGEILLNLHGSRWNPNPVFDCELTRLVSQAVSIPSSPRAARDRAADFIDVFRDGCADAALAASIFHSGSKTSSN